MAYQRVPETAEIVMRFDVSGIVATNRYHARKPGGYDQSDIDGLAAAIDSTAGPNYKAMMSSFDSYLSTVVRGLDAENDLAAEANTAAGVGTVAAVPLPSVVSFAVSMRTGLTGRNARGRVYMVSIPDTYQNVGSNLEHSLTVAAADAYAALVDGVRLTIEGVGLWNAVIVSRWHNKVKRTEAVTFAWTSTSWATRKFATQRNRRS